jgi:hypothetical protein
MEMPSAGPDALACSSERAYASRIASRVAGPSAANGIWGSASMRMHPANLSEFMEIKIEGLGDHSQTAGMTARHVCFLNAQGTVS